MARTFRDLVLELENYKYSKEHYELMKESAELLLMDQFVENQRFMKENTVNFTEGYLIEATSEEQIQQITESINEKAGKIWITISASVKKYVGAVMTYIKNLFAKKDRYKVSNEFRNKVLDHEFSAQCVNAVSSTIENIKGGMPRVAVNGGVSFKTVEGYELSAESKRDLDFAFAMIQDKIKVDVGKGDEVAVNLVALINDLSAMVEVIKNGNQVSDRMVSDVTDLVNKDKASAINNGVVIDFNLDDVAAAYKKLESYGDISNIDKGELSNVELTTYAETIGKFSPTISSTLSMYNSIMIARVKFIDVFSKCTGEKNVVKESTEVPTEPEAEVKTPTTEETKPEETAAEEQKEEK